MQPLSGSFGLVLPLAVLAIAASLMLAFGAGRAATSARLFSLTAFNTVTVLVMALLAVWVVGVQFPGRQSGFGGMVIQDNFSLVMLSLILASAIAAVVMSVAYLRNDSEHPFEVYPLMLLSVVGMGLMVNSNHWLTLYIGAELQSLPLYVLAAMRRDSARSTEAGLKYFVLSALSSGMMLYGITLIYGASGTLGFTELATRVAAGEVMHIGLVVGMVLVLAGIAFKLSAVPFHMWTPDVYEGAPTAMTAFFALVPKLAGFALLIRLVTGPWAGIQDEWSQILVVLAAGSMLVGAFAALRQDNLKRLLAYSSIGHVGYALMGIAVATQAGLAATLYYLVIYAVMTAGAFACLLLMRRQGRYVDAATDLSGIVKGNPVFAYCFGAILVSMAGIPVFAGFFGKLAVFQSAIDAGFYGLAVIGVLTSVVAAAYYLRICKIMFFDAASVPLDAPPSRAVILVMLFSAIFCTVFLIYPAAPLLELCQVVAEGSLPQP